VILLGGRAWGVGEADYDRRIVWVEPVDEPGRSTWSSSGGTLSMQVCHAIRDTLVDPGPVAGALTRRGAAKLAELRAEFAWVREGRTSLIRDERRERTRWWTFAGGRANAAVSAGLHAAGLRTTSADDLSIGLERATHQSLQAAAGELDSASLAPEVQPRRRDAVKFASCCPTHALETMIRARDRDEEGTRMVLDEPIESASEDGKG
jgi:ATP-dependent Lhr-like helicase